MKQKKKNRMSLVWILLAIAVVGSLFIYFLNKDKSSVEPIAESLDIPFRKQGSLAFLSANGNDTISIIDIEIADNNQRRARGLMYRNSLPADAGMLFIFDTEEIQGFWMKNTYIPLDMLFVNANKEIVTIHANTTPLREWNYASTKPALYVVEVNAGYCAQKGIKDGDKIDFVTGK